ncbi:MAG: amidase [Alphaproteobacteria bacterium]|nr:amidase [Alphaproteobacteria bacterium]
MSANVLERSLHDLAGAMDTGEIAAVGIAEAVIEAHAAREPTLNAYRSFDAELMRRQATALDALRRAGTVLGPLHGLPVSVKDLFGLAGFRTYAGTPKPLPVRFETEGPIVTAMRRAGALLAGKTHTVEFAFGGLGTNRHYGAPRNPWAADTHRVSGGSSSGAGVSLWQGTAVLALGSDTTGSVRMPAAWTGTVGVKVSLGRWPTAGLMPQCESLDTPGLLARSIADAMVGVAIIEGRTTAAPAAADLAGLRIGVPRRPFFEACDPGIVEAADAALGELERGGARLVDIDLPETSACYELWLNGHLSAPEAYTTIQAEFTPWIESIDPNVWARISGLGQMPAAEYIRRRRLVQQWMASVNARARAVDVIALPTIPISPPRLADVIELDGYRRHNTAASRNAAVISLFDLCAVSLPIGLDALGMPVGLQFAAPRGDEPRLLAIALAAERKLGTARQRLGVPPLIR